MSGKRQPQCRSHIVEHGVTRRCQRLAGHEHLSPTMVVNAEEVIPPHQHRFKREYDGGWQLWAWNNDYEIEYSSGGDDS